jgi:hypothetical protein
VNAASLLATLRAPSAHPSKRRLVAILDAAFPNADTRSEIEVRGLLGAVDDLVKEPTMTVYWLSPKEREAVLKAAKRIANVAPLFHEAERHDHFCQRCGRHISSTCRCGFEDLGDACTEEDGCDAPGWRPAPAPQGAGLGEEAVKCDKQTSGVGNYLKKLNNAPGMENEVAIPAPPKGCCDEWPECSHVLAWYERNFPKKLFHGAQK